MTPGEIVAYIVAITGLIGAFATLRKNRSDNRAALAAIAAENNAQRLAVAKERASLKSETDKRIDERLKEELGRAYDLIDEMRTEIDKLKEEPDTIKAVVRRWIFTLHEWSRANGHTIPWPNDTDMAILAPEFADLSVSLPHDEVRRRRDAATSD